MIGQLLAKVIGTQNEREIKRLRPSRRRDQRARTAHPGAHRRTAPRQDDRVPRARRRRRHPRRDPAVEAFAVVREAGRRVLNMRHFDVQLIGGMVLHSGSIAEMKTGEGKTLVATLPAYLNALEGKGVHVVTVNDYLARRDSEWMGRLYRFLGMTVGVIQHELNDQQRQVAYGADITYGTNNEFGFDYLRDNMKFEFVGDGAAAASLRDRRRSRQHPDRRGADAADHFRPGRRIDRPVLRGRPHHPAAEAGRGHPGQRQGRGSRGARNDRRLHRRREAQDGDAHRDRHGQGRAAARAPPGRRLERHVRPGQHAAAAPHPPGAARAHALPARRRLHDQGRRRRHRRRVHRPPDAGPPLERRPAPGGRGQGEGQDRAREPDARHHHLPELLPQVQEALRHDRHGRNRGAEFNKIYKLDVMVIPTNRHDAAHRGAGPRLPHRSARSSTRSSATSSRSRPPGGRRSSARSRSRSPSGSRRCCASAASSTSC